MVLGPILARVNIDDHPVAATVTVHETPAMLRASTT
jgi:hypothetical protein